MQDQEVEIIQEAAPAKKAAIKRKAVVIAGVPAEAASPFLHQPEKPVERPNPRVSLVAALLNIAAFICESPRTETEKDPELQEALKQLCRIPAVADELLALISKGYADDAGRITPYGKKLAMVALSPTPNLRVLFENDRNTAFAGLFAASDALEQIHIKDENIVPGKKGADLVKKVRRTSNYLYNASAEYYGNQKIADIDDL